MKQSRNPVAIAAQPKGSTRPELSIVSYSTSRVTKRQYKSKQSWAHIQAYVARERANGRKSKDIVAALNSQGELINLSQLNRLLKDWGLLSLQHLKPRHKKYILNIEARARRKGRVVRGWWILDKNTDPDKATRTKVTQTQMESARQTDPQTLIDVNPSPGMLVPSPFDIGIDSPGDVEMAQIDIEVAVSEAVSHHSRDDSDMDDRISESDLEISEIDVDDMDDTRPIQETLEQALFEDQGDSSSMENAADQRESTSGASSSQDSLVLGEECDTGNIEELIEGLANELILSFRTASKAPKQAVKDPDSELDISIFAEIVSLRFRSDLEDYLEAYVDYQEEFVRRVDDLMHVHRLSYRKSEDAAWAESDVAERYKIPYKAAKCILGGRWAEFVAENSDKTSNFTVERVNEMMLSVFYDFFGELWEMCGSDTATLRRRGGSVFASDCQRVFRELIVHLPYLLREHGATHWTTLVAWQQFADLLCECFGYLPIELAEVLQYANEIWALFSYSPFWADTVDHIVSAHFYAGQTAQAHALAASRFSKSRARFGDSSLDTIKAASALSCVLDRIPEMESQQDKLGRYVAFNIKQIASSISAFEYSRYVMQNIIYDMAESGQSQRAIEVAAITGPKLYNDTIADSLFRSRFVAFEYYKAQAYFDQTEHTLAIRSLHSAIHRFYNDFHNTFFATDVKALATEVMTARGMVQYSQPHLGRLLETMQEKKDPEKDPLYNALLFAEGSASFQLYIESLDDDYSLPRILAPCDVEELDMET